MKNSNKNIILIITFTILWSLSCIAQRIDTINGVVYYELKFGLRKDTKNNIYFPVLDSPTVMFRYSDKIYFHGTSKALLLKDYIDTASFYRYKHFPFAWDKKHVYLIPMVDYEEGWDHEIHIIKGADPKTFTISPNSNYEAKDKNADYSFRYNYTRKNMSLEVISKTMKYKDVGKGFYRGDNGKLYIQTQINEDHGGGDKWSAYFYREVPNIDVKTFETFGSVFGYAKDKNHIYYRRGTTDGVFIDLVEKADVKSFKVASASYTRGYDKNYSFEQGTIMK